MVGKWGPARWGALRTGAEQTSVLNHLWSEGAGAGRRLVLGGVINSLAFLVFPTKSAKRTLAVRNNPQATRGRCWQLAVGPEMVTMKGYGWSTSSNCGSKGAGRTSPKGERRSVSIKPPSSTTWLNRPWDQLLMEELLPCAQPGNWTLRQE